MPQSLRNIAGARSLARAALSAVLLLALAGCGGRPPLPYTDQRPSVSSVGLPLMEYTIQAGAFSIVENAARLNDSLQGCGLDAIYFIGDDGLYRVRFGNFPTRALALERAEALVAAGIIETYYIVRPEDHPAASARVERYGASYLREKIVRTSKRFIGVPYLWGGASPEIGFDCSGLAMTAYRLNGLNLPRTSSDQFAAGRPVPVDKLEKGDLVFFRGGWKKKISHVGVYIGEGMFVHASGSGRDVRTDSLSGDYFKKAYAGGRTYL